MSTHPSQLDSSNECLSPANLDCRNFIAAFPEYVSCFELTCSKITEHLLVQHFVTIAYYTDAAKCGLVLAAHTQNTQSKYIRQQFGTENFLASVPLSNMTENGL